MGERLYSTAVLVTIFLLGCLFGTRTGLANPVSEEDVQNDQVKPNSPGRVLKKHESFEVSEGESVTMPCNLEYDDNNAAIWYNGTMENANEALFLDREVMPGTQKERAKYIEKNFKVNDDKSLVITRVTSETAGSYLCFVSPELSTTHTVAMKGSGTGEASKNYAGVCVLVTILMTLLHR